MAIEAPYSKYRKQNYLIYMAICLVVGLWCVYDGYFNKKWIEEHTNPDGTPQTYLTFNRQSPPFFAAGAIVFFVFWVIVKDKKIVADEKELIVSHSEKIPYSAIQKIDKTNFDTKGFFVVTYTKDGSEVNYKISNRSYDNLKPILEQLVSKIV